MINIKAMLEWFELKVNTNYKIKKTQPALCNFLVGDPYGIRTHECMRERHVS